MMKKHILSVLVVVLSTFMVGGCTDVNGDLHYIADSFHCSNERGYHSDVRSAYQSQVQEADSGHYTSSQRMDSSRGCCSRTNDTYYRDLAHRSPRTQVVAVKKEV